MHGTGNQSSPFTASSILMSGGPGAFETFAGEFSLSRQCPACCPLAISLVAWSSTSDGPFVKIESRCGSVLAVRWNSTSLVLCTFTSASTTHDEFREHHLSHAPEAVHDFVGLHRVGLLDADEHEVVEHAFRPAARCPQSRGKFILKIGRKQFHARAAKVKIFHRAECRQSSPDTPRPCDA